MNIGGDDKLGVVVRSFGPQATCTGPVSTPPSSCRYIIDEMYKTFVDERFGRPRFPELDVALPLTLRARK